MYQIKQLAKIAHVTVRTLQHYDHINLLKPSHRSVKGYRLYNDNAVNKLQQILFLKELGFSLHHIKELLQMPLYTQIEMFQLQKRVIQDKIQQYQTMLHTIEQTIEHQKEEISMTKEDKFNGLQFNLNPYLQEAKEKFGEQAIYASEQKLAKQDADKLNLLWQDKFNELATIRNEDPRSETVQQAMHSFYTFLNTYFGNYTKKSFAGLGMLYMQDERFKNNIDGYGHGLTTFLSEAMQYYGN